MVLVGALRAARRGAEPDPADLPRARGRLHRPARPAPAARRARRVWRGFDYAAMARPRSPPAPALEVLVVRPDAARGRPGDAAARRRRRRRPRTTCRSGWSSTRRARPPTRRARSTPTTVAARRPRRHGRARSSSADDDRNALVFPFTHIGGHRLAVRGAGGRAHATCSSRRSTPTPPSTVLRRERRHASPAPARVFHLAYLAAQRALPAGERAVPGRPHVPRRRRAEAAAACTTR